MMKRGAILAAASLMLMADTASAQEAAGMLACRFYPVTKAEPGKAPEVDRTGLRELLITFSVAPDQVKDASQMTVSEDPTNILQGGTLFAIRKDDEGGYGLFAKGGDGNGHIITLIPVEGRPHGYRAYVMVAPKVKPKEMPDPILYGVCAL